MNVGRSRRSTAITDLEVYLVLMFIRNTVQRCSSKIRKNAQIQRKSHQKHQKRSHRIANCLGKP